MPKFGLKMLIKLALGLEYNCMSGGCVCVCECGYMLDCVSICACMFTYTHTYTHALQSRPWVTLLIVCFQNGLYMFKKTRDAQ